MTWWFLFATQIFVPYSIIFTIIARGKNLYKWFFRSNALFVYFGVDDSWVKILRGGTAFVFIFKSILWVLHYTVIHQVTVHRFLMMCIFKYMILF